MVGFVILGFLLRKQLVGGDAKKILQQYTKYSSKDIGSFLRSHFHYLDLKVTDAQFDDFYTKYCVDNYAISKKHWDIVRGRGDEHYYASIDKLATAFLMSTDFFLNGSDESRPVNYVSCFSPYISPCWNPLSIRGAQQAIQTKII